MVYKHVIGLKTDSSQSNLGGNTDSNHLIPGEEWAFFIRLAQPSSRTACNTHSFLLFPGIGCRLSSFCSRVFSPALFLCSVPRGIPRFSFFFSPASDAGFSLFCAPPCISAPVSILPDAIRPFRMSFPRHRMPVFFPLYGEVGSSLLRFNPATISRPLRTSTSRPFRMSIPRH